MLDQTTEVSLEQARQRFNEAYPAFAATAILDALRQAEYSRLDRLGHIYLDYTGGSLYADSQLRQHHDLLREHVFGNPHSSNPTSLAITHLVEQARRFVLEYFNASPDEYEAIFTANASGALKLVGESFPFGPGSLYLLTFDNHNSVNGIREYARARGARFEYLPVVIPDLHVDEAQLISYLDQAPSAGNNLFAYPAQSNFSGVQHPLEWIELAQARGWSVLLDAAAFSPSNRLDLSRWRPDFVPLSFYKMFGYPTGVGCLLARRQALARLRRPWFAGGTITVASVQGDKFYLAPDEAAFEDGTLNYLNLPAVEIGLRHLQAVGLDLIHDRVNCLAGWLIENLLALEYPDGKKFARIYGPANTERRGGTITLNFYNRQGQAIDHRWIESRANQLKISLRTGCFCNPGAGEIALGISKPELAACFVSQPERLTLDDFRLCIDGKSTGAVRISFGIASNFADAFHFWKFALDLLQEELRAGAPALN
ncbi:MAG: hypothetical protein B6D39_10225 [Anaerolineae bacterium UTCFX2]|jgi:selenocysteine lyase/cysteine desulfurase|nr:aminotransferase class V-fold PLP-dependent enzyme [Anaerolineae bacterium]MCZ7552217.1 aminotransferase class V-fold PLP-dependent enzyme [Anaerolineales bacterium]OQY89083.1 MAG: hypothetical protein B6D39_10225 [Anaerolineae bacterium UTCFX2]